jgi:hypothetical protein
MARLALHSVVSTHDSASGGDESAGTAEACGEEMELKYGGKMEEWAAMAKQFERGNIDTLTDRHNGILYR